MPASFTFKDPSASSLDFVRNDLQGAVHRNVPDFLFHFLHTKSWSAAVQTSLQTPVAKECIENFASDVVNFGRGGALEDWFQRHASLFGGNVRFDVHPQTNAVTGSNTTCVLVGTTTQAAGAFGQVLSHEPSEVVDDERDLLCFFHRAKQLFTWQPTRKFLPAFWIVGGTVKLWVFDRAGAYSSGTLNMMQQPSLLLHVLCSYAAMSASDFGFDEFVQPAEDPSMTCITFDQRNQLFLHPTALVAPDYIVGPGTSCYTAAHTMTGPPSMVVKFSWRPTPANTEVDMLQRVVAHNVSGVIQLVGARELDSLAHIRANLHFPTPIRNAFLSCIATTPVGRPLHQLQTTAQLMGVLSDIAATLQSLYVEGVLHRDVATKNIVWSTHTAPTGVLIDFGSAIDVHTDPPSIAGSDGFMAIDVLLGHKHALRHDLESLFYVFLWLAIGNNSQFEHPHILLFDLSPTSRLRRWCSTDFGAVAAAKTLDMTLDGFKEIVAEFAPEFASLHRLAQTLRTLLFPERNGTVPSQTNATANDDLSLARAMSSLFQHAAERLASDGERPPHTGTTLATQSAPSPL